MSDVECSKGQALFASAELGPLQRRFGRRSSVHTSAVPTFLARDDRRAARAAASAHKCAERACMTACSFGTKTVVFVLSKRTFCFPGAAHQLRQFWLDCGTAVEEPEERRSTKLCRQARTILNVQQNTYPVILTLANSIITFTCWHGACNACR